MCVAAPTEFSFAGMVSFGQSETSFYALVMANLVMSCNSEGKHMNKDQVKGRVEEAKGKIKEVAGKILDDKGMEIEGNVQKNVGKVRKGIGDLKEDIEDIEDED